MNPNFTIFDSGNRGFRNPEHITSRLKCFGSVFFNFENGCNVQLRKIRRLWMPAQIMIFSCWDSVLFLRVHYIVRVCSGPKMIWVAARRIVACMANNFTKRDFSFLIVKSKSMRWNTKILSIVSEIKSSISVKIQRILPLPAVIGIARNFNNGPKSFRNFVVVQGYFSCGSHKQKNHRPMKALRDGGNCPQSLNDGKLTFGIIGRNVTAANLTANPILAT